MTDPFLCICKCAEEKSLNFTLNPTFHSEISLNGRVEVVKSVGFKAMLQILLAIKLTSLIHNRRGDIKPVLSSLMTTTSKQEDTGKNKTRFQENCENKSIVVERRGSSFQT